MENKKIIKRLLLVLIFEVLYELFAINILREINEYNNLLFLFLDKCLFLILLIILNTKLTKQSVPFSLKLNEKQRNYVSIFAIILFLISFINEKNFLSAVTIGLIASTTEEYLFRGIILVTLLHLFYRAKKQSTRILFPSVISSVLFGLEHFLNLYSQSLLLTVVQVCQTMAMGFLFASVFLRTKNLLFPMILHFCIDFMATIFWGMQNPAQVSFESSFFVIMLYLVIGFVVMIPVLVDNELEVNE
ncbi:CPBP family intramembrane glutamic endopeptidase (plasmid) [Oenococcus alcoholitolerans]|uniref:CAAX prenyl protease 2/Lysostaphin resistance protein A-like domain-containing protein n=1 Tax=Oenococcus alcoholitolerans TaxID=931074 RepID=A0ABR4XSY3_9LACO|nr:hypothetical protein Q757_00055 [Oenococcus alcoholitolerans]